jgi:Cu2+-exporting ATPase/Cu+-exporting ATPase
MKQTFKIKGMHCVSCAGIIERTFKKTEGVKSVEVNYATETIQINFNKEKTNEKILSKKIEPLGYSLMINKYDNPLLIGINNPKIEKIKELKDMKNKLLTVIPLAIISLFIMSWDILAQLKIVIYTPEIWKGFFHHLLPVFATYTLFVVGKPYLLGLYRFLRYGKANMDTLIGIGTSVAFLYSFTIGAFEKILIPYLNVDQTYFDVTIIVITFITLGKYLETRSKIKTNDAIEKLLNLQAKTALVIRNEKEIEISINEVIHGDSIIVKPGGIIPVDGIITSGSSFIDEAMVTGEPMPVEKSISDKVVAGTLNTNSTFIFKATKIGSETFLSHIIKMVENAQGSRAPIQALADKISSVFVPIVLAISFLTLILWLTIGTHYLGLTHALSFGLMSFVGILVIACPCALGLATPTAIIVGVGLGAKEGILIKDAATLELLHKVNVIVVDKTGTITKGHPELVSIKNYSDTTDENFISIISTLENKSEHPIAHAIINYSKEKNIKIGIVTGFENIKGKGLKGTINDIEYFAGNIKLIEDLNLKFNKELLEKETLEGKTPIILANREIVLGFVMISDTIKLEAKEAIENLHKIGVKTIMLTGDNKNTGEYIGKLVGIDEVISEILPEDKLNKIIELQKSGYIVAMAGDGVNDAPAIAQADVGIAMSTGTDVAIESAGITLLHGDISKIVKAFHLSKLTMRGIKQNLFWAFIYNIIGIPIAAGILYPIWGITLNPIFAGMAMALSSVSVVGNSLRLKTKKI